MSGKTFGIFLIVVLLIIGGAVMTLLDVGSGPADPDHPTAHQDQPSDPAGSATGPSSEDPGPQSTKAPQTADPERETALGASDFDSTGQLVISGTVTIAATGDPVEAAEVELLYPDGDQIDSFTTGKDGTYRIAISEGIPSVVDLRAWAEGFATEARPGQRVSGSKRDLTVDFQLHHWFSIEGRVTSSADGNPVDDATIEIRSLMPMYEDDWDDGDTDENGFYRISEIEDLPRTGFDVWVDSAGYVPMVRSGLTLPEGSDVLRVDFELWPSLTIRGVVVSASDRRPLEDAEIAATSKDPEFVDDGEEEISDEDGKFELELDAVPFDGLFILISAEEHSAVEITKVPQPSRTGVIDLGEIQMPPMVRVRGVVINKTNGQPVKSGDVTIYARGAPELNEGDYTDSEFITALGRFEIELEYTPPASAEVYIEAEGYFPLRTKLEIPRSVLEYEVSFAVEPVFKLRGVVRRKIDGTPVAGARVRLLAPEGGNPEGGNDEEDWLVARTRANGFYQLDLPSSDSLNYGVVIEYADQRFPLGAMPKPPAGQFEVERDFIIDLPPMGRR